MVIRRTRQEEQIYEIALQHCIPSMDHVKTLIYLHWINQTATQDTIESHDRSVHLRLADHDLPTGFAPVTQEFEGTRQWDGTVLRGHDDRDCLHDLYVLGLVKDGCRTGQAPLITDQGQAIADQVIPLMEENSVSSCFATIDEDEIGWWADEDDALFDFPDPIHEEELAIIDDFLEWLSVQHGAVLSLDDGRAIDPADRSHIHTLYEEYLDEARNT